MIEKFPQSSYTRGNVQGGRDNLGNKDGLASLLPCRKPNLGNFPCLPIHITIKVAIEGHSHFYTLDCSYDRHAKPSAADVVIGYAVVSSPPPCGISVEGLSPRSLGPKYKTYIPKQWCNKKKLDTSSAHACVSAASDFYRDLN
ncbi:hypothetical protein EVAR_37145_1 [Eumeta japonica]|uniref:Uncharacterized protein n=1 Tax=Eumeta variegata TaxID=151549 RepID=A0A4C1WHW6_EUMVA|nr:hypothetical protein EVAR_37145_1 [Eumeta japonica]